MHTRLIRLPLHILILIIWQPSQNVFTGAIINDCNGTVDLNTIDTYDLTMVLNNYFENDISENPYTNFKYGPGYVELNKIKSKLKFNTDPVILSLNVQSLNSKFDKVCHLLSDFLHDNICIVVVALQEIWRLPHPELLNIKNFTFINKQRNLGQGGGVGFYVRECYNFKIIKNLSPFIEKTCETITIELEIGRKKYLLTSLYRSPSNNIMHFEQFLTAFEELLVKFTNYKIPILIFSDSNINLLNLETCSSAQKYLEMVHSNGFLLQNHKATRIQNQSYSLIDHVISKNEPLYCWSGTIPCDISDHFVNLTSFTSGKTKEPPLVTKSRNFSKNNMTLFREALNSINWEFVTSNNNVSS